MTHAHKFAVCTAVFLMSMSVYAQKEAVILYNNNPVIVELEGDKIKSFVGEAPTEYMRGYTLAPKKLSVPSPNIVSTAERVDAENVTRNAEYSIVSTERINLEYKPNFATLSKEAISELNTIAAILGKDQFKKIVITSHRVTGVPTSETLASNRTKAAITYLKIKGISEDRIAQEMLITDTAMANTLSISFLE